MSSLTLATSRSPFPLTVGVLFQLYVSHEPPSPHPRHDHPASVRLVEIPSRHFSLLSLRPHVVSVAFAGCWGFPPDFSHEYGVLCQNGHAPRALYVGDGVPIYEHHAHRVPQPRSDGAWPFAQRAEPAHPVSQGQLCPY
ncbi:hypothetical protein HG530_010778 [Fusarium avenaceum]|nr:hypothetical protein HG530_010778 [Fusarium avenaceum]